MAGIYQTFLRMFDMRIQSISSECSVTLTDKNILNYTLAFYHTFGYFASSLRHSDLRNNSVITRLCNLPLKCLKQNIKIITFLRELKNRIVVCFLLGISPVSEV